MGGKFSFIKNLKIRKYTFMKMQETDRQGE